MVHWKRAIKWPSDVRAARQPICVSNGPRRPGRLGDWADLLSQEDPKGANGLQVIQEGLVRVTRH